MSNGHNSFRCRSCGTWRCVEDAWWIPSPSVGTSDTDVPTVCDVTSPTDDGVGVVVGVSYDLLRDVPTQHTTKDKEESQDLECLNPDMIDMIHMMKKTNYPRSKQSRVFLYTETYRLNSQCRIFLWHSRHQQAPTRLQSDKDPNPGTESMKVWLFCLVETTLERGNHDKEECQLNVCFSSFNFVNDLSHILIHTLSVLVGFFTHTTLLLILTSCDLLAELATAWSFTYRFGQHIMCEG